MPDWDRSIVHLPQLLTQRSWLDDVIWQVGIHLKAVKQHVKGLEEQLFEHVGLIRNTHRQLLTAKLNVEACLQDPTTHSKTTAQQIEAVVSSFRYEFQVLEEWLICAKKERVPATVRST